jgi:hypothetical protein
MSRDAALVTRDWWLGMRTDAGSADMPDEIDRLVANREWSEHFAGIVGDNLDPAIPTADLEALRNDSERVITWVDRRVAHRAFDTYAETEAAWRVASWAVLADLADLHWRRSYLDQLNQCAAIFSFENDYERRVIAYGAPSRNPGDADAESERARRLARGSLVCMVGAATGLDAASDVWVDIAFDAWNRQFNEARGVAAAYLEHTAEGCQARNSEMATTRRSGIELLRHRGRQSSASRETPALRPCGDRTMPGASGVALGSCSTAAGAFAGRTASDARAV